MALAVVMHVLPFAASAETMFPPKPAAGEFFVDALMFARPDDGLRFADELVLLNE